MASEERQEPLIPIAKYEVLPVPELLRLVGSLSPSQESMVRVVVFPFANGRTAEQNSEQIYR
jgi:hypothetical protein